MPKAPAHAPATPYCNAHGPTCSQPVVVVVETSVKGSPRNFRDVMCAEHGREYFERMLAGDQHIVGFRAIEAR